MPTLIISVGLIVLTKVIFPWASCLRVVSPSWTSSIPDIVLALGSKTIEEVPMLKIPVTLASPTTTKFSLKVTPEPTESTWSLVDVTTPTLIPLEEVFPRPRVSSSVWEPAPPEALAPTHLPEAESYFKNLLLTFALSLSTSSRNSRRTSPPPPNDESCCWIRFTNNL